MPDKTVNMGLKLFPPTPKPAAGGNGNPSRKPSTRRHAGIPQDPLELAVEGQESPFVAVMVDGRGSALDGRRQTSFDGRCTPRADQTSPITTPLPAHIAQEMPGPRSHTSFSEAPTLVRRDSASSHSSAPKNVSPPREEPVMRSIFPRYNPDLALEHQAYFPTQSSPTNIPATVIHRRPYSPSLNSRSPTGLQSPMAAGTSPGRFPRGVQDETVLEPSSNNELKDLWKVVNGWRVSPSEGRKFCLKMQSDPEEPTHTLSSTTQAFYTMRLVPTSTSAQMTLVRHDPAKPPKKTSPSPKLSDLGKPPSSPEIMTATLEETVRRLPPNDGLVALLVPRAASDMVIELTNKIRADSEQIVAAAEREYGRLVWDEDSQKYYLVHPALSTPFVCTISSSPAWSRVEYALEHPELPRNLVRLVRDGFGSGYLEVDTGVAARVDCFYIVDVAISALMLVALAEEKTRHIERFDAPPNMAPASSSASLKNESPRTSSMTWTKSRKAKKEESSLKYEEFEMERLKGVDLESQISVKKSKDTKEEEKVPGLFGLLWMLIKCFAWMLTHGLKVLAKLIIWLSKCLTRSGK